MNPPSSQPRLWDLTTHWVTRDGRHLLPEEMSDLHLLNTLQHIRHRLTQSVNFEAATLSCMAVLLPGFIDVDRLEAERERILKDTSISTHIPIYGLLEEEAIQRGLLDEFGLPIGGAS